VAPLAAAPGPTVHLALEFDGVAALVAAAESAFEDGRAALAAGRLVTAREQFDEAVDMLLTTPDGARSDLRLEVAFDSLLDRISALEVMALREGDGFAEAASESAPLDELLAATAFERPQPADTTEETVRADLGRTLHDIPIDVNTKVLSYVELFQGRLRTFMQEGLDRSRATCR
jgi:membrane-bound lytic murein transglycosylase D